MLTVPPAACVCRDHGGFLGCDAHHVQHIAGAGGTGGFPLLCELVSEGASPHVL